MSDPRAEEEESGAGASQREAQVRWPPTMAQP
jgi:hypothetical protein